MADEAYDRAATLRDELQTLRMDTELGALLANSAFYSAFSESDSERMCNLWVEDDSKRVMCAHPGHKPLYGHSAVSKSWGDILAGNTGSGMTIEPRDVHCSVTDRIAVITCLECVAGADEGRLFATNVFEQQEDSSWRMLVHHAGPIMT